MQKSVDWVSTSIVGDICAMCGIEGSRVGRRGLHRADVEGLEDVEGQNIEPLDVIGAWSRLDVTSRASRGSSRLP